MSQLQKEAFYLGLKDYEVAIVDTDPTSIYFSIKNIPKALTAGKNYFLIKGTSLLKPYTPVKVEVLDVNGNVVYSEIPNVLVDGSYRIIIITVYDNTKNGPATITVLGEATDVEPEWNGKYNVKWQTTLPIDTMQGDVGHAIFRETPRIDITEIYDDNSTYDFVYIPTTMSIGYLRGTTYGNISRDAIYYLIASDGAGFASDMLGSIVTIPSPNTGEVSPEPFVTQITRIVNDSIASVSPSYLFAASYKPNSGKDSTSTAFQPKEFSYSLYNLVYDLKQQNTGSSNKKISYLDVYATHLDTYAGVIKYIEFYKMPGNVFLGKYPVQPHEMLTNGSVFKTSTDFFSYWTILDPLNSASLDSSTLIDSVNVHIGDMDPTLPCRTVNNIPLYFNAGVEYQLSMTVLNKNDQILDDLSDPGISFNITQSNPASLVTPSFSTDYFAGQLKLTDDSPLIGKIRRNTPVYASANFIADVDCTGSLMLGFWGNWFISDVSVQPYANGNFNTSEFKVRIPNPAQRLEMLSLGIQFIGGDGNVVGNYYNTTPLPAFSTPEYTPDNSGSLKPRPNQSYYYIVTGSNTVISYDDNIIDGDLYVSRNLRTGVQISGKDSAMIRSVGYEGWVSASSYISPAGFLLFSGSVLPNYRSTPGERRSAYEGVGLEMNAGSVSGAFRFRADTTGSFIEILSPNFFFGNFSPGGSFISGANGALEIYSSNFHLYPDGTVIIAGGTSSFNAATGSVGGWIISSSYLGSTNGTVKLSSAGYGYLALGSPLPPTSLTTGNGIYLTGSGEFLLGNASGYRIQSIIGQGLILSASTFFLGNQNSSYLSGSGGILQISSSNFLLSSSGDVFISGTINATSGTIGGLKILPDRLLGSTGLIFISGSGAISSSRFQVDENGNVSASSISAYGGTVGGWVLTPNYLRKIDSAGFYSGLNASGSDNIVRFFTGANSIGIDAWNAAPFNVKANGDMSASNAWISGAISATSGKIGGWSIGQNTLSVSSGSLGDYGFVSMSSMLYTSPSIEIYKNVGITSNFITLGGDLYTGTWLYNTWGVAMNFNGNNYMVAYVKQDQTITASIAGWNFDWNKLWSTNNCVTMSSTNGGSFALGVIPPTGVVNGSGIFLSGSGEFLFGSASGYRVQYTNSGGLILSSSNFFLGSQLTQYISGSGGLLQISSSKFLLSSSGDVYISGSVNATTGLIGGWTIGPTFLSSSNLVLDSAGSIYTSNFQSGQAGWKINSTGKAEFENAIIRGTLATTVFEKDVVAAVGGQMIISNATALSGSHTIATTIFYVDNAYGFVHDEVCLLKATGSTGFTAEYVKLNGIYSGSSQHSMSVQRSFGGTAAAAYGPGQVIVSVGALNSGYVYINASPSKSLFSEYGPFIDVVIRTGSSNYDEIKTRVRLGNISGINSSTMGSLQGYGLYTQNAYLEGNANILGTLAVGGGNTVGNTFYVGRINQNYIPSSDALIQWSAAGNCSTSIVSELTPFGISQSVSRIIVNNPSNTFGTRLYPNPVLQIPVIEIDQWWTFSLWAKALSGTPKIGLSAERASASYDRPNEYYGAYAENNQGAMQIVPTGSGWNRYVMSFRYNSNYTGSGYPFGPYIYFDNTGSLELAGIQIERNYPNQPYVNAYQMNNNAVTTGSTGYGMWAVAGGFGGSMQNPVVALTGSGIYVKNVSSANNVYQDGIFIGDWASSASFNGVILSSSGLLGYTNNTKLFSLDSNGLFVSSSNFFVGKLGAAYISGAGSQIVISSSNFFLGNYGSTYVSGSGGKLEISSSNFLLSSSGNVYITGSISATGGNIGGWTIGSSKLTSTANNVTMSSAGTGYLALGNPPPTGYNFTGQTGIYLGGDGTALIGKAGGACIQFDGSNIGLYSKYFELGDGLTSYVLANGGQLAISSSNFYLDNSGNVTMTGTIHAGAGDIGGWSIQPAAIQKSGTGYLVAMQVPPADSDFGDVDSGFGVKQFYGGQWKATGMVKETGASTGNSVTIYSGYDVSTMTNINESPFYVTIDGLIRAASGSIGGTLIDATSLTGGIIQTKADPGSGDRSRIVIDTTNGGQIRSYDFGNNNLVTMGMSTGHGDGISISNGTVYSVTTLSLSNAIEGHGYIGVAGYGGGTGDAILYGIYGTAAGGTTNWAGYFAEGNVAVRHYIRIGADADSTDLQHGIKFGVSEDTVLYRSGANTLKTDDDLSVAGVILSSTEIRSVGDIIAFYSDERLKDNVYPLTHALHKLLSIRGVEFDWNEKTPEIRRGRHDVGVIAQEVQKVLPEAVTTPWGVDEGGEKYHSVLYDKLVPLLIEAMREQQNQIESQQKQIDELRGMLKNVIQPR